MKKARLLAISSLVITLLLLMSGACTPTPAPATAPAAAPSHPPVTIRLYGLTTASYPYIMSQAMGEIVNKNSKWLRINVIEGMSSAANLGVLQKDLARRADSFVFTNSFSVDDAKAARPPFTSTYPDARLIATFTGSAIGLYTTNPAIKTVADMAGRSAHLSPRGATPATTFTKLLEVEGVLSRTKVSYGTWEDMQNAVINGTVEVGVASAPGYIGIGFTPSPNFVEPYTSRKLTFVSFTKEQLEKTRLALGWNYLTYMVVPAKAMFPDQAAYPVFLHDQGWWADDSLDDDVAYELARIIVERMGDFATYHKLGEFMRRDSIAWAPVSPELVHKGALRYYRERKIPVGNEAKGAF